MRLSRFPSILRFCSSSGLAALAAALLGLAGCRNGDSAAAPNTSPALLYHAILEGPLAGASVTVTAANGKKLPGSVTLQNGAFALFPVSRAPSDFYEITVRGGRDTLTGREFSGTLCARVAAKELQSPVTVSLLSTLECLLDEENATRPFGAETLLLGDAPPPLYAVKPSRLDALPYKDARFYDNLLHSGMADHLQSPTQTKSWFESDGDGDGLSNLEEILLVTDPSRADTDGDGLSDAEELDGGTDPSRADTDGDGLEDGRELKETGTDPRDPDTDRDFIPDGREIAAGSDPFDGDEDGDGRVDGFDFDPLFRYQWYIRSDGSVVANTNGVATIAGNDLDITPLYHLTWGEGIVQVVDSGVEAGHEDLDVDLEHSWNVVTLGRDPTPVHRHSYDPVTTFYNGHGTAVAGIVAAKANNNKGVRGVAPGVRIAGANFLETEAIEDLDTLWLNAENADDILVSNNSWGGRFVDDPAYEEILREGTRRLRGGKGRIYVFASGNDRESHGNANLSYLANNPYAFTVSALNHKNEVASYSTPGSCVLACAYGGEHFYTAPTLMSTFLSGESMTEEELQGRKGPVTVDEDTNRSYTFAMNGTSAAAPIVSAEIALVLSVCPELGWRDVRRLLARTARQVDAKNPGWLRNGAGLHYSEDYGFGLVDAAAMIEACRAKSFRPLGEERIFRSPRVHQNAPIPESQTPFAVKIAVDEPIRAEWVGLTVAADHPYAGDLRIDLISPAGTRVPLIRPNFLTFNAYKEGFRFGTVAFMDEEAKGEWRVEIRDELPNDTGKLLWVELEIRGEAL